MRVTRRLDASGRAALASLVLASAAGVEHAQAFGAVGHRIAGEIAAPRLCPQARDAVAQLGEGLPLSELGRWADEIRYAESWEHTAPWHYMNSPDDEALETYRTPPEGDVLWAVQRFTDQLANDDLGFVERARALKFVVHFVVDLHQPLHVGRAADRGGNAIVLRLGAATTNLHALWDSGILARERAERAAYSASVAALADANAARWAEDAPRQWAAESKALRMVVYRFDRVSEAAYVASAANVLRERLAQAGVRLAAQLNRVFCTLTP